jgi:hypothetical protein
MNTPDEQQVEDIKLIAEHLMGWTKMDRWKIDGYWDPETKRTKEVHGGTMFVTRQKLFARRRGSDRDPDDAPGDGFCFNPFVSLIDANSVLDKIRSRGYSVGVNIYPDGKCDCRLSKQNENDLISSGTVLADTISRAALEVVKCTLSLTTKGS